MKHVFNFWSNATFIMVVYFTTSSLANNTTSNPIDWICPEGYSGVVRHPYDCQLFYQCSSTGDHMLMTCPNGQYFNPATEYCEIPSRVPDCQGGSPPPPTPTTTQVSPTTNDPINWICPGNYDGYIRHPFDCQLFYECRSTSSPQLYECPYGLYFSPKTERCEFPSDVPDCQGGSPPPIRPTTTIQI